MAEQTCREVDVLSSKSLRLRRAFLAEGALELLFETLQIHMQQVPVVTQACAAIRSLTAGEPQGAALATGLDGLSIILDAMCIHMHLSAVQIRGSLALTALMAESEPRQSEGLKAGVVQVTMRVMQQHSDVLMALEAASGVLHTLCKGYMPAMIVVGEVTSHLGCDPHLTLVITSFHHFIIS